MDASELKQIVDIFIREANENLSQFDEACLQLEQLGHGDAELDTMLRAVRTLKGSSAALGFSDLVSFAAEVETFLTLLKKKEIELSPARISLLWDARRLMSENLACIRSGKSSTTRCETLVVRMLSNTEKIEEHEEHEGIKSTESAVESVADDTWCVPENLRAELLQLPELDNQSVEPTSPEASGVDTELARLTTLVAQVNQSMIQTAPTQPEDSIRMTPDMLETIISCVDELVTLRGILDEHRHTLENASLQPHVAHMSRVIQTLQDVSTELRMVKIRPVFLKLQRWIRDTAQQLNKDVEIIVDGEDTEIDKSVMDNLNEPLTRIVQNALEHGLESVEERRNACKHPKGTVRISASQKSHVIVIEIRDDGRGLGFKTLEAMSNDASKRGVGLNGIAAALGAVHGRIEVNSTAGAGNCVRIIVPQTLAALDGCVVSQRSERYIIAKNQISELLRFTTADIQSVDDDKKMLTLRGNNMPLFHLEDLLPQKDDPNARSNEVTDKIILVTHANDTQPFALVVDDVLSQQQVSMKKLGREWSDVVGVRGAAILRDGSPALILDLHGLTHANVSGSFSREDTSDVNGAA